MRYALILLAIIVTFTTNAQQLVVGKYRQLEPPRAYLEYGYNDCNFLISNNGVAKQTAEYKMLRFGLSFEFAFSTNAYFQFGVLYVFNGCDTIVDKVTEPLLHVNTVQVPLNIMYKFGNFVFRDDYKGLGPTRFFVGGGVFLGFNLSGTKNSGGDNLVIGSESTSDLKNFGAGFDGFAGVRTSNGWMLKATYEYEILNLSPDIVNKGNIMYNVIAVTIAKLKNPKKKNHKYNNNIYYPRI